MNVKALQRADRWLGVPLCWALTVWRAFRPGRPAVGAPQRLLIVKLAEQGSTVLASAALRRAVEICGRDNVHFLTLRPNRFILDLLDLLPRENVVTIADHGITAFASSALAAVRTLRRRRIDTVVDMEFFSRGSAAVAFLVGAPRRVGFHGFDGAGPYRGDLMTHRLIYNPHLHTSQTFLLLVEATRADPTHLPTFPMVPAATVDDPPQFVPTEDERAMVRQIVADAGIGGGPLVLLNANASDLIPLRRWPAERYVELARRILARYPGARVAFTGGPNETDAVAALVPQVASARCASLAGKTTLRELLVLYTLADVLVTNDSGPAHFATLTPIRVVTLFGPETPRLYAARTQRNTVLWAGIACSPCVNAYNNRCSPCRDNRCMQAISVDDAARAVVAALGRAADPAAVRVPAEGESEAALRPDHGVVRLG